jgi:hypothetical protein
MQLWALSNVRTLLEYLGKTADNGVGLQLFMLVFICCMLQ